MDGPVALSVRGVDKSYKRRQVLTNVSFDVRRGEALAIVGENGAGKTTLLRICAGVLGADRGEIARIPVVAYCPQESGLIEHLTAAEHVRYVGAGLGLDPERAAARGAGLLRWLRFPDGETAHRTRAVHGNATEAQPDAGAHAAKARSSCSTSRIRDSTAAPTRTSGSTSRHGSSGAPPSSS